MRKEVPLRLAWSPAAVVAIVFGLASNSLLVAQDAGTQWPEDEEDWFGWAGFKKGASVTREVTFSYSDERWVQVKTILNTSKESLVLERESSAQMPGGGGKDRITLNPPGPLSKDLAPELRKYKNQPELKKCEEFPQADDSLVVDGQKVVCRVVVVEYETVGRMVHRMQTTDTQGKAKVWTCKEGAWAGLVVKREETRRWVSKPIDASRDKREGTDQITEWIVELDEKVRIGRHELTCWVRETKGEYTVGGRRSTSTGKEWCSKEVPGAVVQWEDRGSEHTRRMQVTELILP